MSKELSVTDQREVTFYGDELVAVRTSDGNIYVAPPTMCEALGLNIQAQARRIGRHEILSEGYAN